MYQYRQIIIHLRLGESVRSIARTRIADRKTVTRIRDKALEHGWLDPKQELPNDNILAGILANKSAANQSGLLLPYQKQVEKWHQQGIEASTIYATLQRQHSFTGSYNVVQRFIKGLTDQTRL